jgi:hypothetical protein
MKTKNLLVTLFAILLFASTEAQVPQGIPYQAAARLANGQSMTNSQIMVRFSIIDSIATGNSVYSETHSTLTNALGMFNLYIGMGNIINGTFSGIKWETNAKFLKVEIDVTGSGNNFTNVGTQQMLSVPYALRAKTAENIPGGFIHFIGEQYGGGVVFHVYKDASGAEHGLIVALTEQSTAQAWSNVDTTLIGNAAQSSWDGLSNSMAIVNQSGHTNSAASLCLNLISNGYDDWYLPAILELLTLQNNLFNVNKTLSNVNGTNPINPTVYNSANSSIIYWSSTEQTYMNANYIAMNYFAAPVSKSQSFHVRAVRKF